MLRLTILLNKYIAAVTYRNIYDIKLTNIGEILVTKCYGQYRGKQSVKRMYP